MGLAYDPKAAHARSNSAVQYVVTTTGDPLFPTAYAQTSGGAASQEPDALAVKADSDRMAVVISPDGVELVAS